ncbi:MAG: hypothetical protein HUU46_11110 [Candidatus Hydrogenedentes bacterium]|nr:hypothetical protein [Candidatus Hydrogenedentota bacterium]
MRKRPHRPAPAQQLPDLTNLLILAQILSLIGNALRNGVGRFLDFIILLFSL